MASYSALLFITTFISAILMVRGEIPMPLGEHLEYTAVSGYFQQDDPVTDPYEFDYVGLHGLNQLNERIDPCQKSQNFGLIDRTYDSDGPMDAESKKTQWQRFEAEIKRLNQESSTDTQYKVLYMGRHGEGYHNIAEAFYGTKAWDCYWSLQNGNSTSTWLDAELTSVGVSQALAAHTFWASMIKDQKIPLPQSYYVSPLLRCLQTAHVTFSGLDLPADRPFTPTIKELFRECIGAHTCDQRSRKSIIKARFPDWCIEPDFTEMDELWSATLRETDDAMDQRARVVLDEVFSNDSNTYISISSHSGQIASALRVLQHRPFSLNTGQAIPVLVKIKRVAGPRPPVEKAPWFSPETCLQPPEA